MEKKTKPFEGGRPSESGKGGVRNFLDGGKNKSSQKEPELFAVEVKSPKREKNKTTATSKKQVRGRCNTQILIAKANKAREKSQVKRGRWGR